jgi:hypothetical protein
MPCITVREPVQRALASVRTRTSTTFWRPDGTAISVVMVTALATAPEWNLARVELDAHDGDILVRLPGSDEVVGRYTIDSTFRPQTRSVEVLSAARTLWLDSDAVFFLTGPDESYLVRNTGSIHIAAGQRHHIVALYANGSRELIYEGIPVAREAETKPAPREPAPRAQFFPLPVVIAWSLLGVFALWRHRTNRRQSDAESAT